MRRIVRVHHPDIEDKVLDQVIEVFFNLRGVPRLRKRPSTSEPIDWIKQGAPPLGSGPEEDRRWDPVPRHAPQDRRGRRAGGSRKSLMFIDFFYELRKRKVPVATQEWLLLLDAMGRGLHDSSLDGFYQLARMICVKNLAHYDAFDAAFLSVFKGIEADSLAVTEELLEWLKDPRLRETLSDEEKELLARLDLDALRALYKKRLAEQRERHDGGNRWIGTGGKSPFGTGGKNPAGIRVGDGGGRSAVQVANERRFREYRSDVVLDVRRVDLALRLLRDLGREGAPAELDLDGTIDETGGATPASSRT